jgi:1,4-alpha-glucan branching enzyme
VIKRSRLFGTKTRVTFCLPSVVPASPVSVVGTFNNWEPGRHELQRRRDGSHSVTVTLGPGTHQFRYLADGGIWFDDEHADHIDAAGSQLYVRERGVTRGFGGDS